MSRELPPSRTAEQFVVRFPDGMRDRIAEAARADGRSMNAEIVARLAQSFEPSGDANALREELKRADQLIELQLKFIRTASITEKLLASQIVEIVSKLPKSMLDTGEYRLMAEFAHSTLDEDPEKTAAVLRKIFQSDDALVKVIDDEMERLAPVIAARKRGESTLPFLEADLQAGLHKPSITTATPATKMRKLAPKK